MSLQSWLKEFYSPVSSADRTWSDALSHSLLKWEGALPKNLRKHRLDLSPGLKEALGTKPDDLDTKLPFRADNCALCRVATRAQQQAIKQGKEPADDSAGSRCGFCPLAVFQGGGGCESVGSAFHHYFETGSPTVMLKNLRQAQRMVETNPKWDAMLRARR